MEAVPCMLELMKITSHELLNMDIVDKVIPSMVSQMENHCSSEEGNSSRIEGIHKLCLSEDLLGTTLPRFS